MLKTARNISIANLALSNMFLCLFSMPLTKLDLIHKYWPLVSGRVRWKKTQPKLVFYSLLIQEILCQLTSASQSACIFFSSFSVVAIAGNRLLFIAYPERTKISKGHVKTNLNTIHFLTLTFRPSSSPLLESSSQLYSPLQCSSSPCYKSWLQMLRTVMRYL